MSFTCKQCGSSVHYDIEKQKLKCQNCNALYQLEEYNNDSNLALHSCSSCGGAIVTEENALTAATICPYCGSPVMIKSAFEREFKPDAILPFQVTKKQVMDAYREQYEGKLLIPPDFKSESKVESIQGLYVPFWMHDFQLSGDARLTIPDKGRRNYHYTASFIGVPIDGSEKIENALMESIEPFDLFHKEKEFHAGYLSGFSSDRYDVDEASGRANVLNRIKSTIKMLFHTNVGCKDAQLNPEMSYDKHKVKLVLCPVWIVSTKYKDGKIYQFVMNGQTGKNAGNFPIDKTMSRIWVSANILFWGMITLALALFM